jgi:hypothetical protein
MAVGVAYRVKNLASRTGSVSMMRALGYRTGRAKIGQGLFPALEARLVGSGN